MNIAFCTLFDRRYLSRGLTLIRSLRRQMPSPAPEVFALCLDDISYTWLSQLGEPGLRPIAISTLEATDPELPKARRNRSHGEYCFTLSPCLPLHLLNTGRFDAVVSLDADLFFLSDPTPLLRQLEQRPIFVTRHAFTQPMRKVGLQTGNFNVSFQGFRNDAIGRACLNQWRRQCLEWCFHRVDEANNRYADQRYLDSWPDDFPGQVTIFNPPVAGLAPWNLRDFPLSVVDGHLHSNGLRPVFYHFHGLHFLGQRRVANSLWRYHATADPVAMLHLYAPYLRELIETEASCAHATGTLTKVLPDTLFARWRAQTYFEASGDSFRPVDLSSLHPLQQAWRLLRRLTSLP